MTEYNAIVMDPPWDEPGGCGRGADDHYKTMSTADIAHTIVRAPCWRPAKNCHLYMWATMTSLLEALWLMDALGFTYKTHVMWVKTKLEGEEEPTNPGLGQYFRGAHELVLFGTRGKGFAVRSEDKGIPSVFYAPVLRLGNGKKKHSAKPPSFLALVERRTIGPKLEMFARSARPGWEAWGDELQLDTVGPLEPEHDERPPWG